MKIYLIPWAGTYPRLCRDLPEELRPEFFSGEKAVKYLMLDSLDDLAKFVANNTALRLHHDAENSIFYAWVDQRNTFTQR